MTYREEKSPQQISRSISIICKTGRDPEFVYYLLSYRWEHWKSFGGRSDPFRSSVKAASHSIAVAIPSFEDQQAIAKPLIALDTKVEVAEKKVAVLQDLFRTLLHELMAAKTRVHKLDFQTPPATE